MSTDTTDSSHFLPTEPGVYRGREGDIFLLSSVSQVWRKVWPDFSGLYDGIFNRSYMEDQMPLTIFAETPVSVPEPLAPARPTEDPSNRWGVAWFGDLSDVMVFPSKESAQNAIEAEYGDILVYRFGKSWGKASDIGEK